MHVKCVCVALVLVGLIEHGMAAPTSDSKNTETSSDKIRSMQMKLSKLRSLLDDLTQHSDVKGKETEVDVSSARSKMASESDMSHDANAKSERRLETSEDTNADTDLSALDGKTLRALESALATLKNKDRDQNAPITEEHKEEAMGTFLDEPITEKDNGVPARDTYIKELAKLLASSNARGDNSRAKVDRNEYEAHLYPDPKEGRFGMFRQEALNAIEDKLLGDVDFALENGFTLDEIIRDLEIQETEAKSRDVLRRLIQRRRLQYRD